MNKPDHVTVTNKGEFNIQHIMEELDGVKTMLGLPFVKAHSMKSSPKRVEETIILSLEKGPVDQLRARLKFVCNGDGRLVGQIYEWGYGDKSEEQGEKIK